MATVIKYSVSNMYQFHSSSKNAGNLLYDTPTCHPTFFFLHNDVQLLLKHDKLSLFLLKHSAMDAVQELSGSKGLSVIDHSVTRAKCATCTVPHCQNPLCAFFFRYIYIYCGGSFTPAGVKASQGQKPVHYCRKKAATASQKN